MKKKHLIARQVEPPVFSYWQALYMAFYSRQLYVDVAKRWRGVCFLYLLLMIAVASIPLTARYIYDYNQFINDQIVLPLAGVPPLTLRDGVISFNEPMPYLVKSKTGTVVAMIDTRTNGEGMTNQYPKLMLLVTRDKFYFRPPTIHLFPSLSEQSEPKEAVIKQPEKGVFNVLILSDWLNSSGILRYKWIMAGIIYPFVVSFLFGMFFSLFLMVTMVAQVYAWLILKCKIKFTEALRVLIVSSTPQVFVLLLFLGVNILFPSLGLIGLILCVMYFTYAVLSVKREARNLARL